MAISFQVLLFIYIPPSSGKRTVMIYNTNTYSTGQRFCGERLMSIIPSICCKMVSDLAAHSVLSLLAVRAKRETQWVTA